MKTIFIAQILLWAFLASTDFNGKKGLILVESSKEPTTQVPFDTGNNFEGVPELYHVNVDCYYEKGKLKGRFVSLSDYHDKYNRTKEVELPTDSNEITKLLSKKPYNIQNYDFNQEKTSVNSRSQWPTLFLEYLYHDGELMGSALKSYNQRKQDLKDYKRELDVQAKIKEKNSKIVVPIDTGDDFTEIPELYLVNVECYYENGKLRARYVSVSDYNNSFKRMEQVKVPEDDFVNFLSKMPYNIQNYDVNEEARILKQHPDIPYLFMGFMHHDGEKLFDNIMSYEQRKTQTETYKREKGQKDENPNSKIKRLSLPLASYDVVVESFYEKGRLVGRYVSLTDPSNLYKRTKEVKLPADAQKTLVFLSGPPYNIRDYDIINEEKVGQDNKGHVFIRKVYYNGKAGQSNVFSWDDRRTEIANLLKKENLPDDQSWYIHQAKKISVDSVYKHGERESRTIYLVDDTGKKITITSEQLPDTLVVEDMTDDEYKILSNYMDEAEVHITLEYKGGILSRSSLSLPSQKSSSEKKL